MTAQFGYLLNAMERAACESNPAEHDYKGKRIAVLGYVSALEVERERLRAELETERMRLVACSVIALANTPESAASARDMHPDYQSPSCDDVARAIDREIALRAELAECRAFMNRYAVHQITCNRNPCTCGFDSSWPETRRGEGE